MCYLHYSFSLSLFCFLFLRVDLDASLAVPDYVVLRFGGNSGIHCNGVSICEAEVICHLK